MKAKTIKIEMKELNKENVKDVNRVNGKFTIDSKLNVELKDNIITYTITDVPQYEKRYKNEDKNYLDYIDDPDRTVYLAYHNNTVAGQIILRKNWNNYAYIEDIAVDAAFRKCGIGKALLSQAIKWARKKGLAGVMLETQNNNVAACTLYEKCGFTLGGFDTYLYKGLKDTDEIALYWYYLFETSD